MTEAPHVRVTLPLYKAGERATNDECYAAIKALYAKAREQIAALGGDTSETPMTDIDSVRAGNRQLVSATFYYRPLAGELTDGA